ncbi:MAG: type II secretion system F family protein [Anaerolineae bacterium]|nr:type II secretion system F family protein [Anaerolineae bacterium]
MNALLSLTDRAYRLLLGAYPLDFRREYADDVAQLFRDVCRDAAERGGSLAVLRLWPLALWDVATNALQERLYSALMRRKQMDTIDFDRQLGYTVKSMTILLRAGYSVMQAITMIADQSPEPTASALKRFTAEVEAGKPSDDALTDLKTRMPSEHLAQVVDTMLHQRETGGNLADFLDPVAVTITQSAGEDPAAAEALQHFRQLVGAPSDN